MPFALMREAETLDMIDNIKDLLRFWFQWTALLSKMHGRGWSASGRLLTWNW